MAVVVDLCILGRELPVNLGVFVVSEFLPRPYLFSDNIDMVNPSV
jgi:hypothetical protein